MFRPSWKKFMVGVILVVALTVSVPQANAFWGWGCYQPAYSCYTPCYATSCYTTCYNSPCYSSCYDVSCGWYVGVRPGPIRRAVLGPYRWYRSCYYDCCCDPCCYSCCYTPCCTDSCCTDSCCTGVGACDAVIEEPTPAKAKPTPAKGKKGATDSTAIPTRANSGLLTIWVPAKAKVFINGLETQTIGTRRRYVSYGLQPGLTYKYVVRAQIVRNGKLAEEIQTVSMTAGASEGLAFGFNPTATQSLASAQ